MRDLGGAVTLIVAGVSLGCGPELVRVAHFEHGTLDGAKTCSTRFTDPNCRICWDHDHYFKGVWNPDVVSSDSSGSGTRPYRSAAHAFDDCTWGHDDWIFAVPQAEAEAVLERDCDRTSGLHHEKLLLSYKGGARQLTFEKVVDGQAVGEILNTSTSAAASFRSCTLTQDGTALLLVAIQPDDAPTDDGKPAADVGFGALASDQAKKPMKWEGAYFLEQYEIKDRALVPRWYYRSAFFRMYMEGDSMPVEHRFDGFDGGPAAERYETKRSADLIERHEWYGLGHWQKAGKTEAYTAYSDALLTSISKGAEEAPAHEPENSGEEDSKDTDSDETEDGGSDAASDSSGAG